MAKPPIFGPGLSFTTWSPPRKGTRTGILQLGRLVAGPTFMRQGPAERLAREDQLSEFTARRIGVTVMKLMFSAAQLYVEGHVHAPLVVEGSDVQHGRGNATRRREGNKVYISGTEAAHFGIGTVKRQGESLSVGAARQVVTWQATSGYPEDDARGAFEANGALAGIGLECDGSTFLEPGFMNQSDGLQERRKQSLLIEYAPRIIPATPDLLERHLQSIAVQAAERLLQDREAVIGPLEDRLALLNTNVVDSEYLQDPMDVENTLFGGSERNYLEKVRDLHRNPNGGLHNEVGQLLNFIPVLSGSIAELADLGREERVNAPTYEPTPPEAGGGGG